MLIYPLKMTSRMVSRKGGAVSLCRTSDYKQKVPCRTSHLMKSSKKIKAFGLGILRASNRDRRALPRQTQHAELHVGWL
jgi:hypothetical protein